VILFAKGVTDVQQDVLVHVKQIVKLLVKVVQTNAKVVQVHAKQIVTTLVKTVQLVLDVLLHVQAVLAVMGGVQQDVRLGVLVLVKLDVQAVFVVVVLAVIVVPDAQVVLLV
jgi:hypothetical protein